MTKAAITVSAALLLAAPAAYASPLNTLLSAAEKAKGEQVESARSALSFIAAQMNVSLGAVQAGAAALVSDKSDHSYDENCEPVEKTATKAAPEDEDKPDVEENRFIGPEPIYFGF